MISNFSSLIELFAAIYLTISLDDILLRRFWSTDYKKKVRAELNNIKMPEIARRETFFNTFESSTHEERKLRKRGALFLGLCLSLLILIGYSDHLSIFNTDFMATTLITIIILNTICYIFDGFFLKSWWRVFLSIFLIPLISLFVVYYYYPNIYNTEDNSYCLILVVFAKSLLVIMLIMPVLWQLFRNWFYTRYYLVYISDETRLKVKYYKDALNYNPSNDSHSINDINEQYRDIAVKSFLTNEDRNITEFLRTLQKDLSSIQYVPTLIIMIKSSISSYKRRHPKEDVLKELYKKYSVIRQTVQMKQFCEDEYLDPEHFKKYISKQSKTKQ